MAGKRVIIVGGVAGGAACAARLRRLDEAARILMIERGEHISYASCGLPYYVGDLIREQDKLAVETPENMGAVFNLDIRTQSEVVRILREEKAVEIRDLKRKEPYREPYDKLVLSPGAVPLKPPLPGMDLANIFTLRSIPDSVRIKEYVLSRKAKHAVVVGGGFIGLEIAENLVRLGLKVVVNELLDQVLAPLDFEMAAPVHQHLKANGVDLYLSNGVKGFEKKDEDTTLVHLNQGETIETNLVVLSIGVRPETRLAREAGLEIGDRGGVVVNASLQTSDPDIYAVGDVIEVVDFISREKAGIPLAGPAAKQGRIVADNIAGREVQYHGTQGTSIVKVFDMTAAATGNSEKRLVRLGVPYRKSIAHGTSHAGYYPGAGPLTIKILFTPDKGGILGAQAVGMDGVDKRIDVIATAMRAGMTVFDLERLELAYAPPYGSAKDPVNMAGFVASNLLKGDSDSRSWNEIAGLDLEKTLLLDIRTREEAGLGAIVGSLHIPLKELRGRLGELPKHKEILVFCQTGQRSYYAERILKSNGFVASNLCGGYKVYKAASERQSGAGESVAGRRDDPVPQAASIEVDACGLACPGPIMKVAEQMKKAADGDLLKVTATDPGFYSDIQVWAKQTRNRLIRVSREKGEISALIQKGTKEMEHCVEREGQPRTDLPDAKTMVIFSGDLDKAIAGFIIANGAVAMGRRVTMFFTFWGLNVLRRSGRVHVDKTWMEKMFGGMMPRGAGKLGLSRMNMGGMGALMIKNIMRKHNVSSLEELIRSARDQGVRLIACQMSMDLMGIKKEELLDGVEIGGVATFLGSSDESNATLFI